MLKRISVESILVMLLFVIFTASIGILIVHGKTSFESIISEKEENEQLRITYAYIDKKIKQYDQKDSIQVVENPYNEYRGIRIVHQGEEEGYETYIFFYEDGMYEVMISTNEQVDVNLGEKIMHLDRPIRFSMDQQYQLITVSNNDAIGMTVHLTSKAVQ